MHAKGQGTGPKEEVGQVLYMRGLMAAMLVHRRRASRAQERFGKGKVSDQRAGALGLREPGARPEEARRAGLRRRDAADQHDSAPTTAATSWARVHTWDGSKWDFTSDWYEADESVIKPMIKAAADKYAAEKKITRRTPEDCQSDSLETAKKG